MDFCPGGEGCVIDGSDAISEPRFMFGDRRGERRNGSAPGAMAETKIHDGVVSGMKGGRSWSNEEVTGESGAVVLIS